MALSDEDVLRGLLKKDEAKASSHLSIPIAPSTNHSTKHSTKSEYPNWDFINGKVDDFIDINAFKGKSRPKRPIKSRQPLHPTPTVNPQAISQSLGVNPHLINDPLSNIHSSPLDLTRGNYKKLKGISSQRSRRFPVILPDDRNREIIQRSGKYQLWFFMLTLLGDPTKKSIIIWTGIQRQFRIRDFTMLCHLWSKHNGQNVDFQFESLRRTLRTAATNGICMAVSSTKHGGQNEKGEFGFTYGYAIEVSSYLGMTRERLDSYIELHCETGPLTTGSPIDTSIGYPAGTKLQVIPIMELDSEGNLIHPIPDNFITVLPQSSHSLNPSHFPSTSAPLNPNFVQPRNSITHFPSQIPQPSPSHHALYESTTVPPSQPHKVQPIFNPYSDLKGLFYSTPSSSTSNHPQNSIANSHFQTHCQPLPVHSGFLNSTSSSPTSNQPFNPISNPHFDYHASPLPHLTAEDIESKLGVHELAHPSDLSYTHGYSTLNDLNHLNDPFNPMNHAQYQSFPVAPKPVKKNNNRYTPYRH